MNSCIHSGSNEYSGGNTVWYNYPVASAGTIVNKDASDTTGNVNTATESICPKGWTLPTRKQMGSNTSVSSFLPVIGGYYTNGVHNSASTRAFFWGNEAVNTALRNTIRYDGNTLGIGGGDYFRYLGSYIRCVSEEKTVLDLTYMQDMTPAIS